MFRVRLGRALFTRPENALVSMVAGLPFVIGATLGFAYLAMGAIPPVPVPPENPITESKRVLGKILFWDEQLSSSNVVSCGTCHTPARAGADDRLARNPGLDGVLNTPDDILGSAGVILSDAENDYARDPVFGLAPQITGRAANSMINAAFAPELFWDGRARSAFTDPVSGSVVIAAGGGLESQVVEPPLSPVEMAHAGMDWSYVTQKLARVRPLDLATNHPADIDTALAGGPGYPELFRRAFGDEQITPARIAMAIATYERTLISDQTPFDAFRAGQPGAMTPQQVQGFQAFQQSSCAVCHTVANDLFTGHTFRNIGLRPVTEDRGRQDVTGSFADRGKFKVPGLRNVGLKRTFMHNGQFQSLTSVIQFYARAPGAAPQFPENRDPVMLQVNVPPQAANLIQNFLATALTDPRVANQTFPFDRPLLVVDRPEHRAELLGGGVAGSGGVLPRIIAQAPSMVGNLEYRVGVDGALGGANATLVYSFDPPANGRVRPDFVAGSAPAAGVGAGMGLGTLHWPLEPGLLQGGQTIYAQWRVEDPGAPNGVALSSVARVPIFCGSSGCPPTCDPDVNADGSVDQGDVSCLLYAVAGDASCIAQDPDFNRDGSADQGDVAALIAAVAGAPCP